MTVPSAADFLPLVRADPAAALLLADHLVEVGHDAEARRLWGRYQRYERMLLLLEGRARVWDQSHLQLIRDSIARIKAAGGRISISSLRYDTAPEREEEHRRLATYCERLVAALPS